MGLVDDTGDSPVKFTLLGPATVKSRVTETYGPCWHCGGSGNVYNHESTVAYQTCLRCGGSGQIVITRTTENF